MTIEEFVKSVSSLEHRICEDPIVSPEIKELATVVRILAESLADDRGAIQEHEAAIDQLMKRPTKSVTVNYTK